MAFLEKVEFPAVEFYITSGHLDWQEAVSFARSLGERWVLPNKETLQAYAPQLRSLGYSEILWSKSQVRYTSSGAWSVDAACSEGVISAKANKHHAIYIRDLTSNNEKGST